MSVSVQQRGSRHQVRVIHKLLPRPFFFTFDSDAEARSYGNQLHALLDRGIVPQELLAKPAPASDPLLIEVVRAYVKGATHLTDSDDALLGAMLEELVGVRVSMVSYAWAERYVQALKRKHNLAPGTVRKRVGALARVLDWHLRSSESKAGNALRLLPKGYSQYTAADRQALGAEQAVRFDVQRDRRLAHGEEARIRPHLGELDLLFDILVGPGLRLREAFKLHVDQYDGDRRLLHVHGSKGTRGQIKPRTVPLTSALSARIARRCRGRVGLMFDWWDGRPETLAKVTSHLSREFGRVFQAAGCADLSAHDLRHEAACRWFEHRTGRGWTFSELEVCRIMGWSSMRMALRYASLRGEDLSARLR